MATDPSHLPDPPPPILDYALPPSRWTVVLRIAGRSLVYLVIIGITGAAAAMLAWMCTPVLYSTQTGFFTGTVIAPITPVTQPWQRKFIDDFARLAQDDAANPVATALTTDGRITLEEWRRASIDFKIDPSEHETITYRVRHADPQIALLIADQALNQALELLDRTPIPTGARRSGLMSFGHPTQPVPWRDPRWFWLAGISGAMAAVALLHLSRRRS